MPRGASRAARTAGAQPERLGPRGGGTAAMDARARDAGPLITSPLFGTNPDPRLTPLPCGGRGAGRRDRRGRGAVSHDGGHRDEGHQGAPLRPAPRAGPRATLTTEAHSVRYLPPLHPHPRRTRTRRSGTSSAGRRRGGSPRRSAARSRKPRRRPPLRLAAPPPPLAPPGRRSRRATGWRAAWRYSTRALQPQPNLHLPLTYPYSYP